MSKFNRRDFLKATAVTAAASAVPAPFIWPKGAQAADTVKVGILHSLTGTIAIAEKSVVDAEMLAIDEINKGGGVMGQKIEPVVEDGASDWPTFAEKARKLMEKDKVAAVMGCYTSASRKAVLPVFEKLKGLLYYPTYYEGLEMSPNIMYTAQEATQSVIAAMEWLYKNKGKSFYMIGSDYIWPRTTIKIAKAHSRTSRRQARGRRLLPAGTHRVLVRDQQDQGRQTGRDPELRGRWQQRRLLQATRLPPASTARTRPCCRWRCPRRKCPGSARKTPSAPSPAWATSRV